MYARLIFLALGLCVGTLPVAIASAQVDPSTALLLRTPDSVWPASIEDLDPEIYLVRGRATRNPQPDKAPAPIPATERPSP